MKNIAAILFFLFATPAMAFAQETVPLPNGQTMLILSATEQIEVSQDILVASLRFEKEATTSKAVQEVINKKMADALVIVKKMTSLKIETGSYQVYSVQEEKQPGKKWRGSQTLMITSEASEDVLQATAALQEMGFSMNSLEYQLSPKKYHEVRDSLMEKTITALHDRAKRVAHALDKSQVDLIEVNLADSYPTPVPFYARQARSVIMASALPQDAMAPPAAAAGTSTVSLTIQAKAVIKP